MRNGTGLPGLTEDVAGAVTAAVGTGDGDQGLPRPLDVDARGEVAAVVVGVGAGIEVDGVAGSGDFRTGRGKGFPGRGRTAVAGRVVAVGIDVIGGGKTGGPEQQGGQQGQKSDLPSEKAFFETHLISFSEELRRALPEELAGPGSVAEAGTGFAGFCSPGHLGNCCSLCRLTVRNGHEKSRGRYQCW